jgi:hypothetical protein
MQKWITTCCLVIACTFISGCASSHHNYQEVDDVYVTEQDRASERAEQMATEEQERIALQGPIPMRTKEKWTKTAIPLKMS